MPEPDKTRYVALLYSIILGAGKRLVMQDLKEMARDLGFENPQTLLSTGNLLFSASRSEREVLEARLEAAYAVRFGRHVDFLVRDGAEWSQIVAANPFPEAAERDPSRVMLRVMRDPLSAEAAGALASTAKDGEQVSLVNGDLWIYFEVAPAQSRLLSRLSRQKLGIGTIRNWNTASAIKAALPANQT